LALCDARVNSTLACFILESRTDLADAHVARRGAAKTFEPSETDVAQRQAGSKSMRARNQINKT
jgi:hypothetical protein